MNLVISVYMECSAAFDSKIAFREHRKLGKRGGPAKPGKCSICNEEFESQSQLKIHRTKVHTGGQVICCEECGAEFIFQSDLLRHKVKHNSS